MNFRLTAILLALLTLNACVDDVPTVSDPSNIVVNGERMTHMEFLEKHCDGKTGHETCTRVRKAASVAAGNGEIPRF